MRLVWIAFKAVLTIVLLAVVGLLAWMFTDRPDDFSLVGVASVFLLLAALLWVKLRPGTREFGLLGIVLSFLFLFAASRTLLGDQARACSGKRLWCGFENALHALGGPWLAAAPFFLLGLGVLWFSVRVVVRHSFPR